MFEDLGLVKSYITTGERNIRGHRQRMMIAVASMIANALTIVDEPTSARPGSGGKYFLPQAR